jgi:tRNA pseudouridine synthase 10
MKFSRYLSQTPWIVNHQRIGDTSVEELIGIPMKEMFRADQFRFSSAGREDIDVRMLGKGRPFAIELINPRLKGNLFVDKDQMEVLFKNMKNQINNKTDLIRVLRLFHVTESDLELLKKGEETKRKVYRYVGK